MKEILKKYKAGFIITIVVFVLLLAFTVTRYLMAMKTVESAAKEKLAKIPEEEINDAGWNIPEIQEKKKEVHWLERHLQLAKTDSLNLGINLADSIVQVQLRGTVLLQARIRNQIPAQFFESLNYGTYLDFTKIASIVEEQATIVKRPVKRVQAPKNEDEAAKIKHDTIPDPLLVWKFKLDNDIEVVITGIGLNKDSVVEARYNKDILNYSTGYFKKNLFPKTYIPTLFIWLNDNDAKALYRAIPEKGKVAFRN
jgi:hypothetical protein